MAFQDLSECKIVFIEFFGFVVYEILKSSQILAWTPSVTSHEKFNLVMR